MKTKSLAELQSALQDFVLDKTQHAADLTLETPAFSRQERLGIYHHAYRLRLIDALRNDYTALEAFVGEDDFLAIANEFITAYPSHHPSLRWLGEKLAEFLSTHTIWKTKIPIAEIAAFEWAQTMAFDAADEPTSTLDDVRALAPDAWMTMQLKFHESAQLLNFYSNAPALWSSLINEENTVEPEIMSEANAWLIWRDDLRVVYRPLQQTEAWALQAFLEGKNFAEVCEGLCEWFDEEQVPMQAAQYLQQWILGNVITKILTAEQR
ncbi:DUF2063 domain-containing protein [Cellvibrio zantedeschiae]|uniref:DUF2063 domain-containing protein n=1 Tax=Cellvibrio zantedeschiae TaxID=1237077 RepID=A0ABQ3ATN6_9GAMM|nr:putative DNA-binding domain-containing protein [Cellvibrio zantedeschiae]GGY65605.1 DUF2063 domain-containing protein [Cellvibrio zantedeschiae]